MKVIAKFSVEESLSFYPVLQNHVVGQYQKGGNRMSLNLQLWKPQLKKQSQNPRDLQAICSMPEQNIWKNLTLKLILRMILSHEL